MWVRTVLTETNSVVPISRREIGRQEAQHFELGTRRPLAEPAGSRTFLAGSEFVFDSSGDRGQPSGVGEAVDLGSGLGEISGRLAEKTSADPDSSECEQRVRMW